MFIANYINYMGIWRMKHMKENLQNIFKSVMPLNISSNQVKSILEPKQNANLTELPKFIILSEKLKNTILKEQLFLMGMSQTQNQNFKILNSYLTDGYVVIPKVISLYLCQMAIEEAERLKQISGFLQKQKAQSNFFVDDFNKVSNFFEAAYSEDTDLDPSSMIKIGHALHTNKIFEEITYCRAVQKIQSELEVVKPLVVQSMILEKLPKKGGKVVMHQDSTYLLNQPESIKGYWLPLQDVNKDNGCIWVLPGSHNSKLYEKFTIQGGMPKKQFNGPVDYQEQKCVPVQMDAGDLLIFSGRLLHKSHDNFSKKSRYAYSWHTLNSDSEWHSKNWLSLEQINKYQVKHV